MDRGACIFFGAIAILFGGMLASQGMKDSDRTSLAIGGAGIVFGGGLIWFGFKGPRIWARLTQPVGSEGDSLDSPNPRFQCPKCRSDRIFRLPPNFISPFPAYECRACEKKLRGPGTGVVFGITAAIGAAVFLGLAFLAGKQEVQRGQVTDSAKFAIFGGIVFFYSLVQLARPAPQLKKDSDADLPATPS